jgi:hypothetical protein
MSETEKCVCTTISLQYCCDQGRCPNYQGLVNAGPKKEVMIECGQHDVPVSFHDAILCHRARMKAA